MTDTVWSRALIGAWTLKQWSVQYPDGRPEQMPFGPDAEGLLIYVDSGWMSAMMCARDRSASAIGADYLQYAGRWHVLGDDIIHDVHWSMNPVLIATRQVRHARLLGNELRLQAVEQDARGRSRSHRIDWIRA